MKKYTKDFKLKIVNEYEHRVGCKELCSMYSISKSSLYEWIKLYKVRVGKNNKLYTYEDIKKLERKLK